MTGTVNKPGDVYFISHGGPPTIEQYDSEPYKGWLKFGKLLNASKPKGIIVVSAHWENNSPTRPGVIVNNNPTNPIVYDFRGFPKHFYEMKFESRAEPELQKKVVEALKAGGVGVRQEDRGLDHGAWVPFLASLGKKAAFPVLQVSLPDGPDPRDSIKLGKALSKLRDEGYAIVGSGQVVHNLPALFSGRPLPFTSVFLNDTKNALTTASDTPSAALGLVTAHPLYRTAHPTDEHFFPLLVAAGAVRPSDKIEEIYVGVVAVGGVKTENEGLGWGMWRWSALA
ncbi:hypothetical protein IAT38_006781 [Cryptococcus sp. DSM 104549]